MVWFAPFAVSVTGPGQGAVGGADPAAQVNVTVTGPHQLAGGPAGTRPPVSQD
jgi:hypothetical protein